MLRLCQLHPDCEFLAFTNGTLIDAEFANEMLRVKNFIPAINIEGFAEATNSRRGQGTYQKVMQAMDILKAKKLPFGASCCYTSANIDSLSSQAYMVCWWIRAPSSLGFPLHACGERSGARAAAHAPTAGNHV